jgi:pSer/pThr/pTyr-binding forkhead associated (FHA) protein
MSMVPTVSLTVMRGAQQGQVYSFAEPCRIMVGRSDDCVIQIPRSLEYADISRHHCEFEIEAPTVKVRDLGSLVGTFLNGVLIGKRVAGRTSGDTDFPVPKAYELNDGDEVQVGHNVFRVGIHATKEALAVAHSSVGHRSPSHVRLEISESEDASTIM